MRGAALLVTAFITVGVAAAGPAISPWLYLDRCTGGCTVMGSETNNAMANETSIQPLGTYTIGEFANGFGQLGSNGTCLVCPDSTHAGCSIAMAGSGSSAATTCTQDSACTTAFPNMNAYCDSADADWTAFVQCMTEVDSYFALNVVDAPPSGVPAYTEAMTGGLPTQLGLPPDVLGIAPSLCGGQNNTITFVFASAQAGYGVGGGTDRVLNLCWTAAQQTAVAWGLRLETSYIADAPNPNGSSTCTDAMGISTACGGERFHRNLTAFTDMGACTPTQNPYRMLLALFGAGTPIVPNPTATITSPAANAVVASSFQVTASAGSKRGVFSVKLLLNGYPWTSTLGAAFGEVGQPDPSTYTLVAPPDVPNGATDIIVQACDDAGYCGNSTPVTVAYGADCTSDAACAAGQHCNTGATDNGRAPPGGCYWDAPTGELGATCTYPQFCVSGICAGPTGKEICTQDCVVGDGSGACPSGMDCEPTAGSTSTSGTCYPPLVRRSGCSCGVGCRFSCSASCSAGGPARGQAQEPKSRRETTKSTLYAQNCSRQ